MKNLLCALLVFAQLTAWADDKKPIDTKELEKNWENPQKLLDNPDLRPSVDKLKETLNIGSDEDLLAIAKSVNPEIIKKVVELNIELTPTQIDQLEKLAMNNKGALVAALITGNIPKGLLKEAEKIVPELKKLDEKSKEEVFKAAGKTVNKLVFDKMVKAELALGYLYGDLSSTAVAQLNAKLLNIRKITLGGIEIEDVHIKVELGYPKNGLTLLSGKVKVKDSNFSYQGELLGLSHDIQKHALEFTIAEARINYNIFPWLQAYSGVGFGVKSYSDGVLFAVDPKVGVEAKGKLGPVSAKVFVEGTYRIAEENAVLNCGVDLGIDVLNNNFIQMQTGLMSHLTIESNPKPYGNKFESFNGVGISGSF